MIFSYRIPMSIGTSVNVIAGRMLGAGDHRSAARAAKCAMLMQLCIAAVLGVTASMARFEIPKVIVFF